jgi:phosphohistidine phosphatase
MTHLYLVQHGAAKTETEDPKRPLTDEGRRAVERMADFLSKLQPSLDRIEHSGKLRAKETAEILAAQLRPTEGTREIPGIAPNDDVEPMRARLQKESKNIMLVGHLPYLSRLAARLLGLGADRTVVEFQMGRWCEWSGMTPAAGLWGGWWFQNCWCVHIWSGTTHKPGPHERAKSTFLRPSQLSFRIFDFQAEV